MSHTYEDALIEDWENEKARERFYRDVAEDIEGKRLETLIRSVKDGFKNSHDTIQGMVLELKNLDPTVQPQSVSFLTMCLLEVIEREVITFPLLLDRLELTGSNPKLEKLIRDSVERKIDPPHFTIYQYEFHREEEQQEMPDFKIPQTLGVGDKTKPWEIRKALLDFRNAISHGKRVATTEEARFLLTFSTRWRESVYNTILRKYGLEIDQDWRLIPT